VPTAANEALVRRIFDAFARKEGLALRGLFAEDAVQRQEVLAALQR
jgi:ketosteroid isomerase-like protein